MALTALMLVILIVGFALMVGLVKFTENIIAEPELVSPKNDSAAGARGAESTT